MIENLYGNDDDLEISIGSKILPDIELDEDVNYLREKQRKRWESSQMEIVNLTQPYYSRLGNALLAIFQKIFWKLYVHVQCEKFILSFWNALFDLTLTPKATETETEKAQ